MSEIATQIFAAILKGHRANHKVLLETGCPHCERIANTRCVTCNRPIIIDRLDDDTCQDCS